MEVADMEWKEWAKRRNEKMNIEAGKMGVWHSTFYHNHFEGYAETYEKKGKRRKITHVYVGEYYRQNVVPAVRILVRILYLILFLGGAASCLYAGCLPAATNSAWYAVLPQSQALPALFWLFLALAAYLPPAKMIRKRTYKFAVGGIKKASLLSGMFMLLSAVSPLICYFYDRGNWGKFVQKSMLLFLAAGIQLLLIAIVESRISYEVVRNETPVPENSVVL